MTARIALTRSDRWLKLAVVMLLVGMSQLAGPPSRLLSAFPSLNYNYDPLVTTYDQALNLASTTVAGVGESSVVERLVDDVSGPSVAFSTGLVAPRRVPGLSIDDAQFGRKVGRHAEDFGLDPSDPAARSWLRDRIQGIHANADEVRRGPWHPKGGGGDDYLFFRQGSDVLVTDGSGGFVSILRGGQNNSWYEHAGRVP